MSRGPAPTPTDILKLRGSAKANRRQGEPQPERKRKAPPCPSFLPPVARKEWRRVAGKLVKQRVLTDNDLGVLAAYCQRWSDYVEAEQRVQEDGAVCISDKGNEYLSAWENRKTAALKDLVKFAAELGLTPAARTRIRVEKQADVEPVRKRERRA